MLDELDWELNRRGLRFLRHADDANIFVGSRSAAKRVMASVQCFLEKRLRLFINAEKHMSNTDSGKSAVTEWKFEGEQGNFLNGPT